MQTTNESSLSTTTPPASRISQTFAQAQARGRSVLIPYFMCGYPNASRSVEVAVAAARAGADLIELGMPFSDPLADGPTIQHAGHVALEHGMTIRGCMEVARQIAAQVQTPLLLMGHYNPILAYGLERFCADAVASGVCGLLIPDLPPEEATPLQAAAHPLGLSLNFLIPPTTSDVRIEQIVKVAAAEPGGFLYCVSLSGTTGVRAGLPPDLRAFIERVRRYARPYGLPLVVGFGLSKPEHIAEVTSYAEGAAVGSALVNMLNEHAEGEQVAAIAAYIASLRPLP